MNKLLLGTALSLCMSAALAQQGGVVPPDLQSVAQEELVLRQEMQARIERYATDENGFRQAVAAAQERTVFCGYCHGEDGNSTREYIPNLAGQNPTYLLDQFDRFGDGRRKDFVMAELAKSFTDEEKVNLAIYYSTLEMRPAGGDAEKAVAGQQIFTEQCAQCHGHDAKGEAGYARLAGQHPTYVVKMLQEFRDKTGRRANPWMSAVAVRLSDADMEAVAAYLANLK